MRFKTDALILGAVFAAGGAVILVTTLTQNTGATGLPSTLLAFVGLGFLMIGSLFVFAAPGNMIPAQVANQALDSYVTDLNRAAISSNANGARLHYPATVLGGRIPVLLVLDNGTSSPQSLLKTIGNRQEIIWKDSLKVLEPVGLGLLSMYERVIQRDFLGINIEHLSRLLTRAVVSELQLASGFSLHVKSQSHFEAEWRKPSISHACIRETEKTLPEFCCLCSSIACALAKATGSPIKIESSQTSNNGSLVTSIFRIEEAPE